MMYFKKLVVAIKHNGKILREVGDIVKLPFGCEFTVLVKNLNTKRVKFKMQIDGTDVLDGSEVIVDANSEIELKRFIRNGNLNKGNAFKFIERTQKIEDGPRGTKVEDGIIRIEFWYEESFKVIPRRCDYWWDRDYCDYWWDRDYCDYWWDRNYYPFRIYTSPTIDLGTPTPLTNNVFRNVSNEVLVEPNTRVKNEVGITVPGSRVDQKFNTVSEFKAESHSNVIILRLVGKTSRDVEITKPVTVKTKQKCRICSYLGKSSSKFCSQCGTSLEVY